MTTIIGIGGALTGGRSSLTALRLALSAADQAGATTDLLDIQALALPLFAPDASDHAGVRYLVSAVKAADGLIWSSPLYHGTISGAFKNALDWLELLRDGEEPYLSHKVVGLIATAGGTQALQAINTMEYCARALRGWVAPLTVPIDRAGQVVVAGEILDPIIAERLQLLGQEVARAAALLGRMSLAQRS